MLDSARTMPKQRKKNNQRRRMMMGGGNEMGEQRWKGLVWFFFFLGLLRKTRKTPKTLNSRKAVVVFFG